MDWGGGLDPHGIGMFGISMSRLGCGIAAAAATDLNDLAALAAVEAVTGDFHTIFERAQPTFKNNYMVHDGLHRRGRLRSGHGLPDAAGRSGRTDRVRRATMLAADRSNLEVTVTTQLRNNRPSLA